MFTVITDQTKSGHLKGMSLDYETERFITFKFVYFSFFLMNSSFYSFNYVSNFLSFFCEQNEYRGKCALCFEIHIKRMEHFDSVKRFFFFCLFVCFLFFVFLFCFVLFLFFFVVLFLFLFVLSVVFVLFCFVLKKWVSNVFLFIWHIYKFVDLNSSGQLRRVVTKVIHISYVLFFIFLVCFCLLLLLFCSFCFCFCFVFCENT